MSRKLWEETIEEKLARVEEKSIAEKPTEEGLGVCDDCGKPARWAIVKRACSEHKPHTVVITPKLPSFENVLKGVKFHLLQVGQDKGYRNITEDVIIENTYLYIEKLGNFTKR